MYESLLFSAALLLSWLLSYGIGRVARRIDLIDHPNLRSSHSLPTPRGGGLAIVVCYSALLALYYFSTDVAPFFIEGLLVAGTAVAVVSFYDDRFGLGVGFRFIVHFLSCLILLFYLPVWPVIPLLGWDLSIGVFSVFVCALAMAWLINLYNFMDGIDGIAGSEAIFVSLAGAGMLVYSGEIADAWLLLYLAACCIGFVLLNWPPARIFMGDVGSAYLGFMLGAWAFYSAAELGINLWVWIILLALFWIDASLTLVWRLMTGQRWREAHRLHLYQQLALRWRSHSKVTLLGGLINIGWLLPWAWIAFLYPYYAVLCCLAAIVPLASAVFIFGMRAEKSL